MSRESRMNRQRPQICEICGDSLAHQWTNPKTGYTQTRHNSRFCSVPCKAVWDKQRFGGANNPRYIAVVGERPCESCSKLFRPAPWSLRADKGRFCSRSCFAHRRSIWRNCGNCGQHRSLVSRIGGNLTNVQFRILNSHPKGPSSARG